MRPWTAAVLTIAAVTGLGFVHPFGDPRAEPAKGPGTLLQGATMPADAKTVLVTKCADCHSSETRWPVYARIAPGSWLIERVPNSDHDLGSVTSTNDGGRNCHTTALKEIDSQRAQSARELAIPTLTLKSKKVAGFFHPSWCTQDMASCPLNR